MLSDRETQVLRLVAEGHTNREIAAVLHISQHTVARHVSNARRKLGARNRAEAVSRLLNSGGRVRGQVGGHGKKQR